MKILLISYNRIGDTILSTGLIDHLLRKYDNASCNNNNNCALY